MSNENSKSYTPEEVAVAVLKKAEEMMAKSKLAKSNTAHEVEIGEEPSTDGAECPAYLAEADIESGSSTGKHGESAASPMDSVEGGESEGELDEDGKPKKKLIPEHEEGMDAETKEAHDSTESESDAEEVKEDDAVTAQKNDEADADKVEDKEENAGGDKAIADPKKKKENPFEKSLFEDKAVCIDSKAPKKTKADVFWDIKHCVQKLKDMKELRWTIEEEAPEAKNAFDKEYKKIKTELAGYCKSYSRLKKSDDITEDQEAFIAKAEQFIAPKPSKLGSFMQSRKVKKQGKLKGCDTAAPLDKKAAKNQKIEKFLGLKNKGRAASLSRKPVAPKVATKIAPKEPTIPRPKRTNGGY